MSTAAIPVYFEGSWSILSSIGLINVLIGVLIIGITSLSPITIVPVVVSAAGAISSGLCYYGFYAHHSKTKTAVASGFADFFWLIQEAGLSMYSYQILIRILRYRQKKTFKQLYWLTICSATIFRITIMVCRIKDILSDSLARVTLIDRLHIGYFFSIALAEMLSSYFLLRKFFSAQSGSRSLAKEHGLFGYLMKSTEIRVTILALIGISRSITYSFQSTAQSATSAWGEIDRFVYVLEGMFPTIMFIDILAAKNLLHQHQTSNSNRLNDVASPGRVHASLNHKWTHNNGTLKSVIETHVDAKHQDAGSSQERIVTIADEDIEMKSGQGNGISKTVEFETREDGERDGGWNDGRGRDIEKGIGVGR